MDPKQRMIRRDFDLVFDGIGLKAYTKTIDGKEVKFIGGTASSNAKDLYGDVISPAGQVEMLTKLRHLADELKDQNSGLTGWLNHSYKIPEDTLGAFVDASLATRVGDGVDGIKGEEYIDLDIECRVTETNPRAVAAWEQVKDGIRHGWSIGAIFTECEWLSNDPDSPDYFSLLVNGVNLLEISLVGIPANQRAWCKNQDDLKERAVKVAEEIVREAHATKSGDRSLARDEAKLRGMVLKSLVHVDGTADTTSTSPITARAARVETRDADDQGSPVEATASADPKKPYGDVEYADPGYQPDGVYRYPLDTDAHIRAAASYFGKQKNRDKYTLSQQKKIEARIEAAEKRHGIGEDSLMPPEELSAMDDGQWIKHAFIPDEISGATRAADDIVQNSAQAAVAETQSTDTTAGESPKVTTEARAAEDAVQMHAAATLSIERPDVNIPGFLAANDLLCKTFGVTLAAVIDENKWVGTEVRSAHLEGDEIQVGDQVKTADDLDVRSIAKHLLGLDESELTELGTQLRALEGDDAIKALAAQAADAIDVLVKASDVQTRDAGDASPDDARDRIALAVGHIAKAVGHGICARAAAHLQKACVELAAAVGSDVPQAGPAGDEDPNELSAQVEKLEPKAGDVIVIKAETPERCAELAARGEQIRSLLPEGVTVLFADATALATIDNDLAQKAQELDDVRRALESANTELQAAQNDLAAKQTELGEIEQRTAQAQTELRELEVKINEAKEARLGRKSSIDFQSLLEARSGNSSEVKPEHYNASPLTQRETLAKTMSGDGSPASGRDIAAGR